MKILNCVPAQSPEFSHSHDFKASSLRFLGDDQLESDLKHLIGRERQLLHVILRHIQEVDRRKLYAARAFSSLYEYLTKFMGYSSSSAQRRIEAARLLNQVPELSLEIQKGTVNLSQIGILTQAVKCKESQTGEKLSWAVKKEILSEIRQKSSAETQCLVAQKLNLPLQQPEKKVLQKDHSCLLTITLSKEQQSKLQRCRELLAAKVQQGKKDFSTVNFLEELMDFYLSKKDPCLSKTRATTSPKALTPLSSVKKQLFQKWDSCQFQDPQTGRTCGEKFQLEMDHLQPRWADGTDNLENLTLLCLTHNQWKYQQQSGRV